METAEFSRNTKKCDSVVKKRQMEIRFSVET